VALPTNLTTVTVTGRYIDHNGSPVRGSVTFDTDYYVLDAGQNVVVIEAPITANLDATGSFAVDLIATNDPDMTPTGWTWTLTPNFQGAFPLTFALPASLAPTTDITVLSPALPNPDPVYSYVLVSAINAPNGVAGLSASGTINPSLLAGIPASAISSGSATNGFTLTADGLGGASFTAGGGGGGVGLQDVFLLMGA
jgi:hypothetical protein